MTAPTAWAGGATPTCWLDVATAAGVDDAGRVVRPAIGGRRKHPTTVDYLDTAAAAGARRVFLVGPRPTPPRWKGARAADWLAEPTPGWSPHERGHYFDADVPVGRFSHDLTGERVQLRRAAEWFGDGDYGPTDAYGAWLTLRAVLREAWRGAPLELFDSPSATGQNLWASTLPRDVELPQLDDDVAALVRSTSPQHRVELVLRTGTLPGFVYLDGRMMYAALTRELGSAPALMLHGPDAERYTLSHPFARLRADVTWRAPEGWAHVGMLLAKDDDGRRWHAPPRGRAWVDNAELHAALRHGWDVDVHAALVFSHYGARKCEPGCECGQVATTLRPLDVFTERIVKARERVALVDGLAPVVVGLVESALRAILLYTIGSFHSTGRDVTRITDAPMRDRRPEDRIEQLGNGLWKLTRRAPLTGRAALFRHPEWSSQVWGRAHARILTGPGDTGALHVPADELIGIRGDALYLVRHPGWPDDGRVGRLRVKGLIDEPVPAPTTYAQLDALRARAERHRG